jgi:hypothetical protein
MKSPLRIGLLIGLAIGGPLRLEAQGPPSSLAEFLQATARFSPDDVAGASRSTVLKILATTDPREVALIGVIGIAAPRSLVVARASALPPAGQGSIRMGIDLGIFSDPAVPRDVAGFSLPHGDVQELSRCQPGSCDVKLPGQAMSELRTLLQQASGSLDSAASAWFRQRMVEYVNGYRARGRSALAVYEDRLPATPAAQVWDAILSRSPYVYRYSPLLQRYLENYPSNRPAEVRESIYWVLSNVPHLRRTLAIAHQVVYSPPDLSDLTLIAARQLYSDHYLDGAFTLLAVVDADPLGADTTRAYLVALLRLHFDNLPSGGPLDIRGKVVDGMRDRTREFLRRVKESSERAYAARPGNW